jgi:3-oxoacyl-[acyl-carrier protein] reductase
MSTPQPDTRGFLGRTALVTGGSRGIGADVALALAGEGADVAVVYRSDTAAAEVVVARIEALGRRATAIQGDVSDEADVVRIFATARRELGEVTILVNNAGIHRGGRLESLALADFRAVLDTNLVGAFLCCREAIGPMRAGGWGRIVNVGSVIGMKGFPGDVAYAASKAALGGLTRALAVEAARDGVTVNLVAPGFVATDMTAGLREGARRRIEGAIPAGRQARADEIAEATVALLRTGYATGTTLVLDGGFTIA